MKKYFWPLLFLVSSIPSFGQEAKYVKDQLFYKVKDDFEKDIPLFAEKDNAKLEESLYDKESFAVYKILKSNAVVENKKASKLPSNKLQRIYRIKLKDSTKIDKLINQLSNLSFIEYVERIPLYEIFYTPNDINSNQWNITKTKIPQAWDLSKGVSTVVIAIVDDAVRIDHEDLAPNIWINPKETANNGIDDDANGYIDDINGFDVADFDNNPTTPSSATNSEFTHGTHCAGIASAKTDNGKGMVSPGFSTKIMAVKTKPSSDLGASLPYAYDGLEYAIASGAANVISMSWGGYGKSSTYQLLINYAHSQGIILIAAAGNSAISLPMYPASYNHVISVGATDINDKITYFSNFGTTLDIMAPGLNIWSTLAGSTSTYGFLSGTSMACPLVAGICGLMLSYAPGSSPDFIQSCLKSSADNIDALNPGYIGQMGAGRINALGALACLKGIPIADFVATTTSICTGQSVNFYDKSFGSGISSWAWTFTGANISSSTVKNPLVTYSTPGTYPVSLKVTNTAGSNTITKLAYITVYQPTASISGSTTITSGQSTALQFDFTGNNPYKVSFSDGTTITSLSGINYTPYYVYVAPTISKTYTISSFSDGSCNGIKSGRASILVATVTTPCQNCSSISGLVASYPFCGNANDVSGNNNTGTVTGAALTTDRFGNANSSYTFNGVNQSISIGNKSSLKMATGLSISLWIKPITIPTSGLFNIISDHAPGEAIDGSGKILRFAGTEIQFIVYGVYGFGTAIYAKYNFSTTAGNTWHHVVGTYDSKVVKLYIDGNLVNQVNNSFPIAINNNPLLIGKSGYGEYFNGQIDDIRIFNRALTSNEVQGYFIEPALCTNTGLVASYPFCGNANDVSGNNINGTVTGATLIPDRFGNTNSAYSFNGVNNTISFSKVPTTAIDNWAISAWIKPAVANQGGMAISNGFDNGVIGDGYSFGMANANGGSFTTGSNLVELYCGVSFFNTGYILNANSWYHVVMQRDAGTLKIYVNGTLLSYTNNSSIPKTPTSFRIGSQNGLRYFNGAIDDVKIYNKALSIAEIQALYNEPSPCPTNTISSNCSKALDFNKPSIGQHVNLGKGFNVPNTFSLQSWVKLHSLTSTGFYNVFSKHISATYLGSYLFFIDNRIPTFYITGVGNVAYGVTSNSALDDNWHHIAGTYDGSTMKIYIDGILNNSFSISCNINQTNSVDLILGTADFGTGIYPPSFDGSMDEPAIFSKTLTQTEIQSYMNGGIPTTTSGLLGYWKFEENDPLICYNSVLGGVNGTIAGNAIRTYDTPFGQAGINCGLVASYPFCGNANDISGNNYTGTVTGSTLISDRFGNPNSAYYFNGSGTSTLDNNIKLNAPYGNSKTPFSLSFWAKADADVATSRSYPTLLNLYNNNSSLNGENARLSWINMILGNAYASNVLGLNSFVQFPQSGGNIQLNSTTVPSTNVWNHFVNTYDPNSNRMQLFINGKLNNSINISGTANPKLFNSLIIGREYDGGNNSYIDTYYKGALDDIKVYTRVLTNTDVQTLYNEPAPCTTTGLVASYPFCGNANDVSGNNYNGTVAGANLTTDRFGNSNSAYYFNGFSKINTNFQGILGTNPRSISAWIKLETDLNCYAFSYGAGYDGLLNQYGGNFNCGFGWGPNFQNSIGSKTITIEGYDVAIGYKFDSIRTNNWHHVVWTLPNQTNPTFESVLIYVDGVLLTTKVNPYNVFRPLLTSAKIPLIIGNHPLGGNYGFKGNIDDIKIYNKALSIAEIQALYNEPAPCITCTVTVTPAISGNQTICTNGIENYSIPTISGINYTWSVTGGNLLQENGNLASVTWTGQGIFTLSGIPSSTCVGISKLTVTVGCCTLTPVKADFIVNTNSCAGQSFSLTNTSINTSLVSTYLWDFGTDAVPSQSTLPSPSFIYYKKAGQKVITLKVIGSGCRQSDSKTDTLFFYPVPIANAGPDIYLCTTLGQSLGSLPISDNQYVWHPGKYLADSTKSQTSITGFYNGNLVLEVRYGESNCVGYDTVQVYQFPTVTPVTQAICRGETVRLNTSFWNNSGIYTWSPTSYIYSNFGNYILVKPDRDTTFSLSINSISGCGIASAKIRVEQKYTLEANYSPRKYCTGDSVTLQVTNPRANFDYTWLKYADSSIFKNGVSVKFAYSRTGIQSKVVESSLCKNTLILPIQVLDSTFVNTYTPVVETLCIEPTLTISSSLAQNKFLWSTGETSNSTKATGSGLYWVKTYNFCEEHIDSFYVTIKTVDNYFPNVFTPNEDEKNDVLIFQGCAFHTEDVSLEIFDRWGGKVYSNNAYKQDWTAKGIPSGMYYYILKSSKSGELGKGWLQIIK